MIEYTPDKSLIAYYHTFTIIRETQALSRRDACFAAIYATDTDEIDMACWGCGHVNSARYRGWSPHNKTKYRTIQCGIGVVLCSECREIEDFNDRDICEMRINVMVFAKSTDYIGNVAVFRVGRLFDSAEINVGVTAILCLRCIGVPDDVARLVIDVLL